MNDWSCSFARVLRVACFETLVWLLVFAVQPVKSHSTDNTAEQSSPNNSMDKKANTLTQDREKRLAEVTQLRKEGKIAEAILQIRKALELSRQLHGPDDDDARDDLDLLGELLEREQQFEAARAARQELLYICVKRFGKDNWRSIDARLSVEHVATLERLTRDQRRLLARADDLMARVRDLFAARNVQEALPRAQEALSLYQQVLGPKHWMAGYAINWIGSIYNDLDDSSKAEEAYREALANRTQHFGTTHPNYASALDNLAGILQSRREFKQAEAMRLQALKARRVAWGAKHADVAASLHNLGTLYSQMREFEKAAASFEEALAIKKGLTGEQDRSYANTLNQLANLRRVEHRYAEAETLYRQGIDILRVLVGDHHIEFAGALNNLAFLYQEVGDYSRAGSYFRQALSIVEDTQDQQHPLYTIALDNLASIYRQSGEPATAAELYTRELELLRKHPDERGRQLARCLNDLGAARADQGDLGAAENAYRQSLAAAEQLADGKDLDYAITLQNLAFLLSRRQQTAAALTTFEEATNLLKTLFGEQDSRYLSSIDDWSAELDSAATFAENSGNFQGARGYLTQARQLRVKTYGEQHWKAAVARARLAQLETMQQLHDESQAHLRKASECMDRVADLGDRMQHAAAIPLAEQALEMRRTELGEQCLATLSSLEWLGSMQNEVGQFEQAEQNLTKAAGISIALIGEQHPNTANTLNGLAFAQSKRGELEKCLITYRRTLEIRRSTLGTSDSLYFTSVSNLVAILDQLAEQRIDEGNFAAARDFCRESLNWRKETWGEQNWQVTSTRLGMSYIDKMERLSPQQRIQVNECRALESQIAQLYTAKHYREALPLAEQLLKQRQELLGVDSAPTAESWNLLGLIQSELADYVAAEDSRRRALEMSRQIHGPNHPAYATYLHNLGGFYETQGRYDEAEVCYREALAVRKQSIGESAPDFASSLNDLALNCGHRGDDIQEEFLLRQASALRKRIQGPFHASYATTLGNLAVMYNARGETAQAEALFKEAGDIFRATGEESADYAWILRSQAEMYNDREQFSRAQELFIQTRQIYEKVQGVQSEGFTSVSAALAVCYMNAGEFDRARPLMYDALEATRKRVGEKHPEYAERVQALAWLADHLGDYKQAETLQRQVLEIHKQVFGERHPRYGDSLRQLAQVYRRTKDYSRAEVLLRQAVAVLEQTKGKRHPHYIQTIDDLGELCLAMDDAEQALQLRKQALELARQVHGNDHPAVATLLNNLGMVYDELSDDAHAEQSYRQSLEIIEKTQSHQKSQYQLLLNLGSLHAKRLAFDKAEPLLEQAAELARQVRGAHHPHFANTIYHLAWLSYLQEDYGGATQRFNQAIDIYRAALGATSPDVGKCLYLLAQVYAAQRDFHAAQVACHQSLQIAQQHVERTAVVQSERQQLASALELRRRVDLYLSCAVRSGDSIEAPYQQVLTCKGAVTGRQAEIRLLRRSLTADRQPEALRTYEQLIQATAKLAALAGGRQLSHDHGPRETLDAASQEVERLEREMANLSAAYRTHAARRTPSPSALRALLPQGTVLVDLLDYWDFDRQRSGQPQDNWQRSDGSQRRILAFISRSDATQVVDLGPTKPIVDGIKAWRDAYGSGSDDTNSPGQQLRALLWQPIWKACQGAQVVLLSPDGEIARLAWNALPGDKAGTYLIEDVALSQISVPAQLPRLLATKADQPRAPSLLLVGDVRFDGLAGLSDGDAPAFALARGTRGTATAKWSDLPGTRDEIEALDKLFATSFPNGTSVALRRDDATESAVRHRTKEARFLHFATHGYFSPLTDSRDKNGELQMGDVPTGKEERDRVIGFHPGLLSGLVLAGANRPVDFDHDDGVLTALEVEALDLGDTELAMLSACETGLGQTAASEGVLGLQRAFHTAGARSVVAGLWKVPDRATQVLMVRFYDNLWRKRLSKLEALREAQLWLLHQDAKQSDAVRGLEVIPPQIKHSQSSGLPPYYWAAFVLSGDWH